MAINQKTTQERKTVVFNSGVNPFLFMKNHDNFLSAFPCNLEKEYVKNLYFYPFPPSLFFGCFVICGFWGCHLWPLTLSFAASEPLICHKWEPQSIALTTQKHPFQALKRCKENGSRWQSTTSENVNFWPFLHQSLLHFKKQPVFWGQNSEFSWQKRALFFGVSSIVKRELFRPICWLIHFF